MDPARQVTVQGDAERRHTEFVVTRLGEELGGLAVAGALVDELAAADQRAPLGAAGGMLGEVHSQCGGEQADRDAQPQLGHDHVVGDLAQRERGAGWAEAKQQRGVLPEVGVDVEVAAQGLLRADDGQDVCEVDQGGEGEAVPVPALLHQDRELADQPRGQGDRREPEQQDDRQPEARRRGLVGGARGRLPGAGRPRVCDGATGHSTPPWRAKRG
jgi:hypothetical protein